MNKPTTIRGRGHDFVFVAKVEPDGRDWHVQVWQGASSRPQNRFVSTIQARPDNGALHVTRMLRSEFNITGTFICE